jgi:hypothetical protein
MILGAGNPTGPSVPTYLQPPKGTSATPADETYSWAKSPLDGYIARDRPDQPVKPREISPLPPAGALPVVEAEIKPKGPRTPKAGKGPKRPGDKRQLLDYEYELSAPELQRVRQENPAARGTIKVTDNTATPLSWEEYDKLSGDQRAAVDFNTLLVQAREIDLKTDPKWYSDADKAQYAKDVEAIFGPMGGSDTLGVKTVELLKKIDFKAVGQDLDEFLSLERAVSAKELKNFEFSKADLKELENVKVGPPGAPGTSAPAQSREEQLGLTPAAGGPRLDVTPDGKPYVDPAKEAKEAEAVAAQEQQTIYKALRTPENMAAVDTAAITAALKAYKGVITTGGGGVWDPAAALGPLQPSGAMMTMPVGYGRLGESANGKTTKLQVDTAIEELY